MGRFYSGDISGKFWFGVQDSDDISELVSHIPTESYIWKSCGCYVDEDDAEDEYCKGCYDSIESHILEVEEEENYEDGLLYTQDQNIIYVLDKETHYQELIDNMDKLKTVIPADVISKFNNIPQNDYILDAFTGVFNDICAHTNIETHNEMVLLARYILGYQIEYCLRITGSCNICCEY